MSDEENAPQVTGESAGSQLKRGREQKGLSVSDVADAQHLRLAVIQAIENGDYQQIDSELFLKGYVRAYAKQVGLDADAIVALLDKELEPLRQQKAEALEANPLVDIERRKRQKRRAARALIVLLAVAVVAALAFRFLSDESADHAEEAGTAEEAEAAAQTTVEPEVGAEAEVEPEIESAPAPGDGGQATDSPESGRDSAPLADAVTAPEAEDNEPVNQVAPADDAMDDPEALDDSRIPAVTSTTDPALTEASRTGDLPGTGRLQVSFSNDCWVEVTDSTGARLVSSLQRAGDLVDVSGQVPLTVVIGAVDAVASIRFQGESVELTDYPVVNNRTQFRLEI